MQKRIACDKINCYDGILARRSEKGVEAQFFAYGCMIYSEPVGLDCVVVFFNNNI